MLFGRSRQDTREVFFVAWQKYRDQLPLEGAETIVAQVIVNHPEYHKLLDNPEQYRDKDYLPEHGDTNPFLHMGMHVAIEEQLSLDRPQGIRRRFRQLMEQEQDPHAAQHIIMECLAEMLWSAQRSANPPDESLYFSCLDKQLKGKPAKSRKSSN